MNEHALMAAGIVLLVGLASQWLAWRLRLPSILLLLVAGVAIGPVGGWLNTDEVMGDLLFPFVSLSVAVILFEGGLTLRVRELRGVGRTLGLLIGVGGGVTLLLGYFAGHLILGLEPRLALLLAAVFVVTGPTVIGPLLQVIRPRGRAGALIKWEGIVNDPIGASLALLVFEALFMGSEGVGGGGLELVLKTVGIGVVLGGGSGWLLGRLLERHSIPDFLQSPVTVAGVVVVFVASDHLQGESGLLAVTLMGIVIGMGKDATVHHLLEFKENLRVLLLSCLFVLLAARIELAELMALDWRAFGFVAALILVVRPVSVWVSTIGSGLSWGERGFLAWMAPRGIVAMAVVSLFALRLEEQGVQGAEVLVPVAFLTVVMTVLVYGLTAGPLARRLGVAAERANGVLFVGASPLMRELARVLGELDIAASLVDTNRRAVTIARQAGLDAAQANALTDDVGSRIDLSGVGSVLAATPNDEVNALLCLSFAGTFGRSNVYQLPERESISGEVQAASDAGSHASQLGGRRLYTPGIDFDELADRFAEGASVKRTTLSDEFSFDDYQELHGERSVPMFLYQVDKDLYPWAEEGTPKPKSGDTVIALVCAQSPEEAGSSASAELGLGTAAG